MSFGRSVAFAKGVWQEFQDDNGSMLAAAVSFFGFLSFWPALLAGVGILGFVLGSPENAEAILTRTVSHFIVGQQAESIVNGIVSGRSAATGIGLVLLLWSGTSAVVALERALNLAWEAPPRGLISSRLLALFTLVVGGLLLIVSFGATTAIRFIRSSSPAMLADLSWLWTVVSYLVPLFLSIAPFVLVYKVLPNTKVSWRTALAAGTLTGLLWEVAKQAFTYYVLNWASYGSVYGSLGSVILLMVWIYYSSTIAVLGAEFGANWSRRR